MQVGRRKKIETREQLIDVINSYFNKFSVEEYTITGLCYAIGVSKDTFYQYAKDKDFGEIIDEARLIVENAYELSLRKNGRTGDIFALKNFGWVDKTEVDSKLVLKQALVGFGDGNSESDNSDKV